MFSLIRRRLHLSPATAIASLALVFAMSGGAYAASKYVITSTKQISPKVLKSLQGKAGPAGKSGANGTNGANGAVGPQGPAGAKGDAGPAGANGVNGEKGEKGENGTTGFTATLPKGKTLKGEWVLHTFNQNKQAGFAISSTAVSFGIPLSQAPVAHYINEAGMELTPSGEQESTVCQGSAEEPTASPGNLCVYAGEAGSESTLSGNEAANKSFLGWKWPVSITDLSTPSPPQPTPGTSGRFGFGISVVMEEEFKANVQGSWAVTAE
jgi:Collagen triple helix repeat (20 copies)